MILCTPMRNYGRTVRFCPTCDRQTRQLVLVEAYHGEMSVCRVCRVAVDEAGGNRTKFPHDFDTEWKRAESLSKVRRRAWREALRR